MEKRNPCNTTIINEDTRLFINMAKGVAIFLMLYGHCIQYCVAGSDIVFFENSVFNVIYSFHMPLFMLISGYLFFFSFSKYKLNDLLVRRIQSLLQPIVFGSILIFFVSNVTVAVISGDYGSIFNGGWLSKITTIWFLWSVLSSSIVVAIICNLIHSLALQIPVLILSSAIVAFFPNAAENLFMYPYFLCGFYFAKYHEQFYRFLKIRYASLLLYPILFYLYRHNNYNFLAINLSDVDSVVDIFYLYCFKWILGFIGSVFILTILNELHSIYQNHSFGRKINRLFANLGVKSLQVYVLSIPFLSSFLSKAFPLALRLLNIPNIFAHSIIIYNYVFTPLLALAYSFSLYCLVLLLEKWKLSKILFGR